MNKGIIVPCVAIISIAALELFALYQGIDGALLSSVIAVIGGIGGYTVHSVKAKK